MDGAFRLRTDQRASRLAGVTAVREPAEAEVRLQLRETEAYHLPRYIPDIQIPHPGSVRDPAPVRQGDQPEIAGRVLALSRGLAHLTHLETQTGLQRVQQAALADAGGARNQAHPVFHQGEDGIEAL